MVKYIANINSYIVSIDSTGILNAPGLKSSVIEHPTSGTGNSGDYIVADGIGGWSWSSPTQTPNVGELNDLSDGVTVGTSHFIGTSAGANAVTGSSSNVGFGYQVMTALTQAVNNTAVGHQALSSNTTSGNNNTAIGYKSLLFTTTGYNNTGLGYGSLQNNTIGIDNTNIGTNSGLSNINGNYNVAVGSYSLQSNQDGQYNIALGVNALRNGTSSSFNIALGVNALRNMEGSYNIGIGQETLNEPGNTANYNVAIGNYSLKYVTTGENNVAIGSSAGNGNTQNVTGSNNTLIGHASGFTITSGYSNVGIGYTSLYNITTGYENVAIGTGAMSNITTNSQSVAIGAWALMNNSNLSIGIGYKAGEYSTGYYNTTVGSYSFRHGTGHGNVAIGLEVLNNNSNSGIYNTGVGTYVMRSNTSGQHNVALGTETLDLNETGSYNVCVGNYSGSRVTTSENIFIGYSAGRYTTSGSQNAFVGYKAGQENTTGGYNTYLGYEAGLNNQTGVSNTGIGYGANRVNTSDKNTAVGFLALFENTSGAQNTAVGTDALRGSGTGFNINTATINNCVGIGTNAGQGTHTNSNCIYIGCNAAPNANNTTNEIVVGANVTGNGTNTVTIGNSSTTNNYFSGTIHCDNILVDSKVEVYSDHIRMGTRDFGYLNNVAISIDARDIGGTDAVGYCTETDGNWILVFYNSARNNSKGKIRGVSSTQVAYDTTSDRRLKENITPMPSMLEKIKQLQPVYYTWKEDGKKGDGFVAQEVHKVFPQLRDFNVWDRCKCGMTFNDAWDGKTCECEECDVENPKNTVGNDYTFGLDYGRFTPYIVKAMQEQQEIIERQEKLIQSLVTRIEALENKS